MPFDIVEISVILQHNRCFNGLWLTETFVSLGNIFTGAIPIAIETPPGAALNR